MKTLIENDKTKFYTVSGLSRWGNSSDGDQLDLISLPGLYITIDKAAEAVAKAVNDVLIANGIKRRVNVKNCYDGYTLDIDAGRWVFAITAHDRPYVVRFMDYDDRTDKLTVYQTKAEAEAAVAKDAKAGIKALGKEVEYVYADRNGDCEIPKSTVKKSEPYVMVDTYGGNHIDWVSQQL